MNKCSWKSGSIYNANVEKNTRLILNKESEGRFLKEGGDCIQLPAISDQIPFVP